MLLHVPALLTPEQVAKCRLALSRAEWVDGRRSALGAIARVKNNREALATDPATREIGQLILDALSQNSLFVTRALPIRTCFPLFNRYEGGESYGAHVDVGLFQMPPPERPMRGDLSATVFITAPEDYDGGELTIEDTYGQHAIKLPAGDMIVYPASSLHYVSPVTRGVRVASFFWIQSAIRDNAQRVVLADLDAALADLVPVVPDNPAIMRLYCVYSNLLRLWAET